MREVAPLARILAECRFRETHLLNENVLELRVFVQRHVVDFTTEFSIRTVMLVQTEQGELGAEQRGVAGGQNFSGGKSSRPMRRALARLM